MSKLDTTTVTLLIGAITTMGFTVGADGPPSTAQVGGTSAAAVETIEVGSLARGDALFWDGPHLDSVGTGTRFSDEVLCESPAATMVTCDVGYQTIQPAGVVGNNAIVLAGMEDPFCGTEHVCIDYAFDVIEEGDQLRVALDQETLRDLVFGYLYDPSGAYVFKLTSSRAEARVERPGPGTWTVRVRVYDARDTGFRMRAALDPQDERAHGRDRAARRRSGGALLPNLQVVPPYELGFGPCQATEIADYGARRCLRFSTGPANVGDGPLDLVVREEGSVEGAMQQRIHHEDGSTENVPAGSYEYHHEHLHYHHGALQSLELLLVTDERRGRMEPAGSGPKMGFCTEPYFIAEWHSFAQDPPFEIYGDDACQNFAGIVTPPLGTQMALARGWADVYDWFIEGNFVDFADNPDGLYVIRAASDPDGHIRETRDDDNRAYTYIHVSGDDIEVLERGIGDSPWDPRRQTVDDNRRPVRWEE